MIQSFNSTPPASDALLMDGDDDGSQHSQGRSPLALLRGRWHWALLFAALLGTAGAAVGLYLVQPFYRSAGQVQLSPDVRYVVEESDANSEIRQFDSYFDAQVSMMRSRQIIEQAVRHEAWQRVGGDASDQAVGRFRGQLEVVRSRGSRVAELRFYDPQPVVAAAGVEAMLHAYQQVYRQQQTGVNAEILSQLRDRRARLSRDLDQLRQRRDEAAGQFGVEGLVRRYQLQLEQLNEVQLQLRQARVQIEARRDLAEQGGDGPVTLSPEQIALHDERMRRMLEQKTEVESYLARGRRLDLGENHREMRRAQVQIDDLNQQIERYARRFSAQHAGMPDLGAGVDPFGGAFDESMTTEDLEARHRDLERITEQVEVEASALGQRQQQVDDLQERIARAQAGLEQTERRIDQLNVESPHALNSRIDVISWGEVPAVPHNQGKRLQASVLGGGGGAMLGLGLVMLMGRLDRRVQHIEDTREGAPTARMLGILPTLPDDMVGGEQVAIAAHCVHHIRTLLQLGPHKDKGEVIVITSPAAGSGKTSLSTALGLSFATSETRTLLIDCDLVGAGLSRRLNVVSHRTLAQILRREHLLDDETLDDACQLADASGKPLADVLREMDRLSPQQLDRARELRQQSSLGLLDVCEGEPLESCLVATGIARMSILPVGAARPHQAGALSPAAIRRVFEQARERFDVIIVDTGPILGSIEASMSTSEADRVVLVVSRGDEKSMVVRSIKQIQAIGSDVAGIVFNHALADDVARSSYASAVSGQAGVPVPVTRLDASASARFGPVGSAVASFADADAEPAAQGTNGNGAGTRRKE